jgi:hypothetical protein
MFMQTIKQHTLGRARSPLRAAARWGQRALPPVAAALVLALAGVFVARTAFAKIMNCNGFPREFAASGSALVGSRCA